MNMQKKKPKKHCSRCAFYFWAKSWLWQRARCGYFPSDCLLIHVFFVCVLHRGKIMKTTSGMCDQKRVKVNVQSVSLTKKLWWDVDVGAGDTFHCTSLCKCETKCPLVLHIVCPIKIQIHSNRCFSDLKGRPSKFFEMFFFCFFFY